jgi:hypothetical protein
MFDRCQVTVHHTPKSLNLDETLSCSCQVQSSTALKKHYFKVQLSQLNDEWPQHVNQQ